MKEEVQKPFTYCKVQKDLKLRDGDGKCIAINIEIPGIKKMTNLKRTNIGGKI